MAVYVVTGGAGFIGSHLTRALVAEGHGVRVIDDLSVGRRNALPHGASLTVADINDTKALAAALAGATACFHLAAVASVERCRTKWLSAHDSNLRGALSVFQQAALADVPVVYASSAAVYGDPDSIPLNEDVRLRPLSAYGADKLGCEMHARAAGTAHGLRSCGLRFFNVYGPGQDPASPYSGVVSLFADRLRRGNGLVIFGDGGQTRDFIHISDVVRALRAAANVASTEAPVTNVCTGQGITVSGLTVLLSEIFGRRPEITHAAPRAGDIRLSVGATNRMHQLLGVVAQMDLRAGLEQTINPAEPKGLSQPPHRN